ncbi:MAG: FAD-dependent oxidoreductase [Candidatus Bathyarchaeota archaeon]|nr:MAG: FAD-dependent oxidoreductase [Candidatus Bathyarchaeota archaeon]
MAKLSVDGTDVESANGVSILEAARLADIYIPALCSHPDLSPFSSANAEHRVFRGHNSIEGLQTKHEGCGLCLIEVEDQADLVYACDTIVCEGMNVATNTERVRAARQKNLMHILAEHPHACLLCAQKEGCSRDACSLNVPVDERCCDKLGNCELEKIVDYVGVRADTPRYRPANLPKLEDEPLFTFNFNRCIGCTRCVRACGTLRGVYALGFTVDDDRKNIMGMIAPTLKASGCRFCGSCVQVCPTGVISDREKLSPDLAPCIAACPVEMNIPSYVRHVAHERFNDAHAVVNQKVPFSRTLGYVCHHPCESACRRNELGDPIAICLLKRAAVEGSTLEPERFRKPVTDKTIAVVGAGPAGLTVAYYLARKGHNVTVFEKSTELGGMLRWGILPYRLPNEIFQADIQDILRLGIDVKKSTEVGRNFLLNKLRKEFDAVFLGVGAQRNLDLNIPGEDLTGVHSGLTFLREVNSGQLTKLDGTATVIGGGDVAIDAARTAVRLGADTTIFYRRSREEMPADPENVEMAIEEGVKIQFLKSPTACVGKDGRITGLRSMEMQLGEVDEQGRRTPIPIEGSDSITETDYIIIAVGARLEESLLQPNFEIAEKGLLKTNTAMATEAKGVFAGGDAVSGPTSVIDAIAMGRQTAKSIDTYLGGDGDIDEKSRVEEPPKWLGRVDNFADRKRLRAPRITLDERRNGFSLVELPCNKELAVAEATRCLQCDLRLRLQTASLPPERWQQFDESIIGTVPETEGVIQLAGEDNEVLLIRGTANLRKELQGMRGTEEVKRFLYEEAQMFTTRESELLQQFLKKHGRLPKQNVDLDDLY